MSWVHKLMERVVTPRGPERQVEVDRKHDQLMGRADKLLADFRRADAVIRVTVERR